MVEAMFFERLQISKLHAADVACEQLIGGQPRSVVLLPMLYVRGPVPVALAALLAHEGLVVAGGLRCVLQRGVAFEQPGRGE
ncbi:hypothetical protein RR46_14837 [Papilio xuthus]|uniref:Uncharacterized protein n=1 Tax=Papilio xuthus TaxID=66420 RepID=A0A194PE79_PAPXU|nr:hypothetical protein RR46_14837 [Papilio xuthus]